LPVSILRPVSTPVNIVNQEEHVKQHALNSSPPHNQLFKTSKLFNDIFENVHHTPKSQRRTPNLAFKMQPQQQQQEDTTMSSSPTAATTNAQEMMDVDFFYQSAQKNPLSAAIKSRIPSMNTHHLASQNLRTKLFDQNDELVATTSSSSKVCEISSANKILNFDDTDNEEEYLKVTGVGGSNQKCSNDYRLDDEMRTVFEQPLSSHSKLSSKLLGPPQTPLLFNASNQSSRSVPPLNTSTSLFRPIQRCKLYF
jgi:hypothetical protein